MKMQYLVGNEARMGWDGNGNEDMEEEHGPRIEPIPNFLCC